MLNPRNKNKIKVLENALGALPHVSLACLPTPFQSMPGLSRELGGPEIWIKRDDMTGLAMGGNKTRMFEYILGSAIARGFDTVVAGAAVQSNYCRQLAAACSKLGLECHLVLNKVRGKRDETIEGGLLLDLLVGARVTLVEFDGPWTEYGQLVRDKAEELKSQGKKVLVERLGNESKVGEYSVGYVAAMIELLDQADHTGVRLDELWVCSSDMTYAGIVLALKHMNSSIKPVCVSSLETPLQAGKTFEQAFVDVGNECAEHLGIETRLTEDDVTVHTNYVYPGYGKVSEGGLEAITLAGKHDGVLLDPVYTSKALGGLIDHIRKSLISADKKVVFIHTGGLPALFAYADQYDLNYNR